MPEPPEAPPRAPEVSFGAEDMRLFAAASGDHSPLHTDPAFARRTAFGEPIVYGGLLSLAMLGALPVDVRARVRSVRSQFPGPVLIGEPCAVEARARPGRPDDWEVTLSGRGRVLARMRASADTEPPAARASDRLGPHNLPPSLADGKEIASAYSPGDELEELARRFGIEAVSQGVLAGINWASYVVGDAIPNFDGLCAAVTITVRPDGSYRGPVSRHRVKLVDHDERTDLLLLGGGLADTSGEPMCEGLIECFPFTPTPPPQSAPLRGEMVSRRGTAVVVGGSRGLGGALALTLLARGLAVHVIYERSAQSADELARLAGPYGDRLTLHRHDAADGPALEAMAASIPDSIDGIALCAEPPPLAMTLTAGTAAGLSEYVGRGLALTSTPLGALMPRLGRDGSWVLVCSCAAFAEPVRDLPQLTALKGAVEGLGAWLAAVRPATRVLIARLPKLRTDRVNTPRARLAAAPLDDAAAVIVARLLDADTSTGVSVLELEPIPAPV